MADEFPITLELGKTIRTFFHSQFFRTPPYPTHSFAGQTIIVTGSNTGLGLEAAKHFYRLNASRVILAVRTIKKGESAKEDIVRSVTHRTDPSSIEVWALDLSNTESTLAFAEKAKGLERLDVLLENAGVNNRTWEMSEGVEQTIQVNVLNTFLLALSLLPKLRETKIKFADSTPHLTIVSSEVHHFTKFKEIEAKNIYERLNEKKGYNGQERYQVSKLLEVLFVRELVSRLSATSAPEVPIVMVNPGLCKSELVRDVGPVTKFIVSILMGVFARTTEVGSRTLVIGTTAGKESHGEFMSDGVNQEIEGWIYGDLGKKAQKKVWEQTVKILEERKPGVLKGVGL